MRKRISSCLQPVLSFIQSLTWQLNELKRLSRKEDHWRWRSKQASLAKQALSHTHLALMLERVTNHYSGCCDKEFAYVSAACGCDAQSVPQHKPFAWQRCHANVIGRQAGFHSHAHHWYAKPFATDTLNLQTWQDHRQKLTFICTADMSSHLVFATTSWCHPCDARVCTAGTTVACHLQWKV